MRHSRRPLDQYFTPRGATAALMLHARIMGSVLEPCSGTGAMAEMLAQRHHVTTNDIDPGMGAHTSEDATQERFWSRVGRVDWTVTNPPFSVAIPILEHALLWSQLGVAMLLRLSFAEPCQNRAQLLADHPPSLIVLPRISFTENGKHDNTTCAWFVWDHEEETKTMTILTKEMVATAAKQFQQ